MTKPRIVENISSEKLFSNIVKKITVIKLPQVGYRL